jgi:hypothetical protein
VGNQCILEPGSGGGASLRSDDERRLEAVGGRLADDSEKLRVGDEFECSADQTCEVEGHALDGVSALDRKDDLLALFVYAEDVQRESATRNEFLNGLSEQLIGKLHHDRRDADRNGLLDLDVDTPM